MYVPVRVYSEENAVLNHSHELAVFGRKALIVTGKVSSRKNGSLDDVISALKMHGREFTVFVIFIAKAAQKPSALPADFH